MYSEAREVHIRKDCRSYAYVYIRWLSTSGWTPAGQACSEARDFVTDEWSNGVNLIREKFAKTIKHQTSNIVNGSKLMEDGNGSMEDGSSI